MPASNHISALIIALILPVPVIAENAGFFAGIDASSGIAHGHSNTKNGGGDPINNIPGAGGIVENVKFKEVNGIGAHVGYQFNDTLSAFISYQHIRSKVSWDANFPLFGGGVASSFNSTATSNALFGNIACEWALTDLTAIKTSAGLGFTYNTLSSTKEIDKASGLFLSKVASHREISPAMQLAGGLRHKVSPNLTLGIDALIAYMDGFETGDTRSGNLGVTRINPYKIDGVWRASLDASLTFHF